METSEGTAGPVLTKREIERSLRINIIAGMFGIMFWWSCSPNVIQLFALRLGAKDFHVAFINMAILITLSAQLIAAYLVERYHSRKLIWMWSSTLARSVWIPVVLVAWLYTDISPGAMLWLLLIFWFIHNMLLNSTIAPWFSWMTDIVPSHRGGDFWGHRYRYISLTSLVMLPLAGLFLDWNVFDKTALTPYLLLITFGLVAGYVDIIFHRWIPEPRMETGRSAPPVLRLIYKPLRNRAFRRFLLAISYLTAVNFTYRAFLIIFLKKHFGLNNMPILMLAFSSLAGSLIISRVWGFLADHVGIKPVLKVLFLGHAILPLIMFTTIFDMSHFLLLVLLNLAWFIDWSCGSGAMVLIHTFFGSSLPRRNRSMYVASFYTIYGIVAGGAPFIGHVLLKLFKPLEYVSGVIHITNYHLLFGLGFIITIPSVFFVSRLIGSSTASPINVLSQILFGRVFTLSRELYILGQSESEERRLLSMDIIGKIKGPVAINGIRKHLDDPSEKVREKAKRIFDDMTGGSKDGGTA